jgi:hypothetical protein
MNFSSFSDSTFIKSSIVSTLDEFMGLLLLK